jgi:hypothetical protein
MNRRLRKLALQIDRAPFDMRLRRKLGEDTLLMAVDGTKKISSS